LSKLALARIDLSRYAFATRIQRNWMPRVLGSMMLRPGLWFRGSTRNNSRALQIPFVFSTTDTALLEMTDHTMRVRVGDELISRPVVSTQIVDGGFTSEISPWASVAWSNFVAASTAMALSADGSVVVQAFSTGQSVAAFAVTPSSVTSITAPTGVATFSAPDMAFSPDGTLLAIADLTSGLLLYSVTGSGLTAAFTAIAAPTISDCRCVAWSPDSATLAVADSNSQVTLYARSGTTFSLLPSITQPTAATPGTNGALKYSPDGTLLALATQSTPFIHIWNNIAGIYLKLSNPGTLPAGAAFCASFAFDSSFLAVAHTTTPFVTIYSISNLVFTKVTNPATLPPGNSTSVAFDLIGKYLAVGSGTTPFIANYSYSGTTFTRITSPSTLPSGAATSIQWSPGDNTQIVGTPANPSLMAYKIGNWMDLDGPGAASTFFSTGGLQLVGTIYSSARRVQAVMVNSADRTQVNAIVVTVVQGVVTIKIGSAFNTADLIPETTLGPGVHNLAFTPTAGVFYIDVSATTQYSTIISSIQMSAAGTLEVSTIWAESDLPFLRWTQSADVVFVACQGKQQQRIERRNNGSWSVVDYLANDGPFRNLSSNGILMTPGSLTGDTTLISSRPFFNAGHLGAIFQLTSIGQTVATSFTGDNQFSNPIRITGVGATRSFSVIRSNTWVATLTLQRSITDTNSWADFTTYTTNGTSTVADGLDNQIVFYRLAIKSGNYTSGQADTILSYASGGLTGVGRVTSFVNSQLVNISVLTPFGATTATENWREGEWSDFRGWPTSVTIYEGRMVFAGKDEINLSVSDAYTSFDDSTTGDSGPIDRTIGEGPVDTINWLLPLQRLVIGGQGSEKSCRSSSFDEILTPSNFNMKDASTQGSAAVAAVKIDSFGVFVQKSDTSIFQILLDTTSVSGDYTSQQLNQLIPEVLDPGVVRLDVQRQPDTRIHAVLNDGTAAVLVFDATENVTCWITVDGGEGAIEDVCVLPGVIEDTVYYTIRRTVMGETVRYLERWSLEKENIGGTLNKNMDAHIIYQGDPVTTVTGLDHLEGETVVAWGDGKDLGLDPAAPYKDSAGFLVTGGQITIPVACSNVVAGLPYDAEAETAKLAWAAQGGSPLNRRKRAVRVGFVMNDTHAQGLRYGTTLDLTGPQAMRSLPRQEGSKTIDPNTVWDEYDFDPETLNSTWSTDNRLCLRARSPRPVTILGATVDLDVNG
jgi:hypothetical protein